MAGAEARRNGKMGRAAAASTRVSHSENHLGKVEAQRAHSALCFRKDQPFLRKGKCP